MDISKAYGVHWFRRDLRVAGNPALQQNFRAHAGRVVGVFCFDKVFLSRDDFSPDRFQFFLETLTVLKKELIELGSDLLVLDEGPEQAFDWLFHSLRSHGIKPPSTISWNRDYEPFARARDIRMESTIRDQNIAALTMSDHLLIEPGEVFKDSPENGYQVYTPFSRKWLDVFQTPSVQEKVLGQKKGLAYLESRKNGTVDKVFSMTWSDIFQGKIRADDVLQTYLRINRLDVRVPIPKAGSFEAFDQLCRFKSKIDAYGDRRDFPAIDATSQFSLYLKNGSLTLAQIIAHLDLKPFGKKDKTSRDKFFSELIWREFYYHILYRNPRVEKESFQFKYDGLAWENNLDFFEAWKNGETGFPIVDAGMRQLNTTGWMHNRVRMIVASFLTKDLLIDWKWGEAYFMKRLLDGDMAPNNGGWQWAASTGCDAQPYFRIFNPWSQSEKFDANGDYIKKYVPELKDVDAEDLHEPLAKRPKNYPAPIIDHAIQRVKALEMYTKR